jgi:hypothetical protein
MPSLLKKFGCPDALPGAGDLDQDAFTRRALLLIQRDELARLGNRRRGIEAQARGDLRGDAAGNHFEDFTSEQNKKTINELFRHLIVAAAALKRKFGSLLHQAPVGRHLGGVKKKRRIRWWHLAAGAEQWPQYHRYPLQPSCISSEIQTMSLLSPIDQI